MWRGDDRDLFALTPDGRMKSVGRCLGWRKSMLITSELASVCRIQGIGHDWQTLSAPEDDYSFVPIQGRGER
jgi:hypothetical protein